MLVFDNLWLMLNVLVKTFSKFSNDMPSLRSGQKYVDDHLFAVKTVFVNFKMILHKR